jgi:DNA repair protein RadA/Sms
MEKAKSVFVCEQCGRESPKWLGRCPSCQAWNSFVERESSSRKGWTGYSFGEAKELCRLAGNAPERYQIPMAEFTRVLGGGIVPGSLILVSGEPGIGKSTLLLQVSALAASTLGDVVYISGEETPNQIWLRARRLNITGEKLFIFAETDLEKILGTMGELSPSLVVIDSIQTIYLPGLDAVPGTVPQVRECTLRLMQWAKSRSCPVLISGHVTKEGMVAGPKVLEHIVDVVLGLEGEPLSNYRLLRSTKNRFGATSEIGVFEMTESGLVEVADPAVVFLSQRSGETPGSAIVSVMEGSRAILVEIQALTSPTLFSFPRRTASGVDPNRLLVISAVLSRRAGLKIGNQDVIVNVAGGVRVEEPAADLAIALAIASSYRNRQVVDHAVAIGEIGLGGEIRPVSQIERRLAGAMRLGFKRFILPEAGGRELGVPSGISIYPVHDITEAIKVGLGGTDK